MCWSTILESCMLKLHAYSMLVLMTAECFATSTSMRFQIKTDSKESRDAKTKILFPRATFDIHVSVCDPSKESDMLT